MLLEQSLLVKEITESCTKLRAEKTHGSQVPSMIDHVILMLWVRSVAASERHHQEARKGPELHFIYTPLAHGTPSVGFSALFFPQILKIMFTTMNKIRDRSEFKWAWL